MKPFTPGEALVALALGAALLLGVGALARSGQRAALAAVAAAPDVPPGGPPPARAPRWRWLRVETPRPRP